MQDRYLDVSVQSQIGVGSSRRPSVVGIGVVFASFAVTLFAPWKLHASGVALWRWEPLVVGIATVCLTIAFTILLRRLESQRRRLEGSEEALRLAKEKSEQARSLAEKTDRQHLEAQRIGKIGHWYTDEASGTT